MRFSISLLTLICIASVIGTVVKQNEPLNNYVNQFGPFWADVFGRVSLFTVYSAPWFLLILAFLVLSTSLCIARNAPKILADLRQFKENLREQSLQAFHHRRPGACWPNAARPRWPASARCWRASGWTARKSSAAAAARCWPRARAAPTSSATWRRTRPIVLICLGGLFDGDLIVRAADGADRQDALQRRRPVARRAGRAPPVDHNPTFRGNLLVPEGARAGMAVLACPTAWCCRTCRSTSS